MEEIEGSQALEPLTLASLATEALNPRKTDLLFVQHQSLFVDVFSRWLSEASLDFAKIAAFGRIVPFAPHLAEYAENLLKEGTNNLFFGSDALHLRNGPQDNAHLIELLLATFRLLSLHTGNWTQHMNAKEFEALLRHENKVVRYLTVRCLCLFLHAADAAKEEMVTKFVGSGMVKGDWEGKIIDYRFLSLWEEKRSADIDAMLRKKRRRSFQLLPANLSSELSDYCINFHGVLLPRIRNIGPYNEPGISELVSTPSTEMNCRSLAQGLLGTRPLLLTGLAGSGKTLLIRHCGRRLMQLESMITLHLNEQSDAKMLIGMYATGASPGTFNWRPGVLTTAVKEGRWIFIEDIDRAPNEIISTLLPLIERGELLVPSRGETVKAARGFKIIATMRTTLDSSGNEIVPRQNMIGSRFWRHIPIIMPSLDELQEIVVSMHDNLRPHIASIMQVYSRLQELFSEPRFASENGTSLRSVTPRDLLKFCDRTSNLLSYSSTFSPDRLDDFFMEAMDCFAGSLRSEQARLKVMTYVAEELNIGPQRRDHLLLHREVRFDVPRKGDVHGLLRIGRARLTRNKSARKPVSNRPFSTNDYTLRLLEKIAVAVNRTEPLLLVGETGTGKTTCIQYLAEQSGRKLVAFNLSQQSESGDMLGGYKPVNVRSLVIPMKDEFDDLFETTFSRKKNARFMEILGKRVARSEWKRVCILWREALKMVDAAYAPHESRASSEDPDSGQPKKKRKVYFPPKKIPRARWEKFAADLNGLEAQLLNGSETFTFSFVEGNIVKAVRNGDWVLLDEINLASSDTLEALADLLGGGPNGSPSLLLTETGNPERIVAHPDFRIFAAMNPATDVGKKDLPPGIRSRFTELYVESPDSDMKSLRNIVEMYLGGGSTDPATVKLATEVTNLYLEIQRLAKQNVLVDGTDQKAYFSLRTLTRTLSYARDIAPLCTLGRALYEGFHMSFLTFLGRASEDIVAPLIKHYLFPKQSSMKAELGRPLKRPDDSRKYIQQGHYWLRQGQRPIEDQHHYIITPFVQRNMDNLIRAASTRKHPVLIQGPTSSGKTSMIEYLARRSGNKFVRINNHEHTDLQEYLGLYVSGPAGKLHFQEGILVQALREGHWIVLDELNLAPTDVLEALNRLLDDNRELLIPETQEVVRPHEDFMLFATQNPAGLYGGRKVLSRAFRNRFLELHFDDIPVEELTDILHRRTEIPESWCKRIVKVYEELATLRQESRIFEQKSFATLRDLFRWALRKADTVQDLANNGYMLLAERVRKEDERRAVKKIIERVMSTAGPRVHIDEDLLFSEDNAAEIQLCKTNIKDSSDMVWTRAMRRLFVLVAHAIRNNEPVLLVGETGCGKTTVCQMLANAFGKHLHIVNAHQNTETGDLIGAQRPIRNRGSNEDLLTRQLTSILATFKSSSRLDGLELTDLLQAYDALEPSIRNLIPIEHQNEIRSNRAKAATLFEWADGSLVHAMKTGQFFLLDEISLADDSVLERLNSVLEPQRTILLAEKGPFGSLVTASDGFQFLATMNPGGDYGKKELSPALRNRFTEIWVPALSDAEDIVEIVYSKLRAVFTQYAGSMVSFAQWFNEKYNTSVASSISIRDTLAWVSFVNHCQNPDPIFGIIHGAAMVFIDTIGANPAALLAIPPSRIFEERNACLHRLSKLLGVDAASYYFGPIPIQSSDETFQIGSFSIPRMRKTVEDLGFSLEAPTTKSNAMRVIRALQLSKPILLEGNPGVGKTTLVTALAKAVGKPLTRMNLSEQTDLMDLFGSDVPVEGGQAGTFAWRDAPFLKAMKNGDWVLLDEMNLASQSVLEGLNAVLDHRGEIYISELDQTFHKHSNFRVFAAQNPHHQGGGRKGLPASFVNRFTVVYADVFRPEDLLLICHNLFPTVSNTEVGKLIKFVADLDEQVVGRRAFGGQGSPWEFNLRDTLRWLELLTRHNTGNARDYLDTIFVQRFRNQTDRFHVLDLFSNIYGTRVDRKTYYHNMSPTTLQVGLGCLSRDSLHVGTSTNLALGTSQLPAMESLMMSVERTWPVVLVGPPGSGKSALINQLASYTGADLVTFSMNADIDAMDLVGGYEQIDPARDLHRFRSALDQYIRERIIEDPLNTSTQTHFELLEAISHSPLNFTPAISSLLERIVQEAPSPRIRQLFQKHIQLSKISQTIDGARFQWVDGILIQALQQGKWLILDNANLCSSSVLDRLNSLLEPNGYLSINEHSTANGEARIVRPHPHFRIFMTVDPRFGELSRAMRNRAVEIYLMPDVLCKEGANLPPRSYPLDSSIYRFRHLIRSDEASKNQSWPPVLDQLTIASEHLSPRDLDFMDSFRIEMINGLVNGASEEQHGLEMVDTLCGDRAPLVRSTTDSNLSANDISQVRAQRISHIFNFLATWTSMKSSSVRAPRVMSTEAHDAQPFHPLSNDITFERGIEDSESGSNWIRETSLYDLAVNTFDMQSALAAIPVPKFERRAEKSKIHSFLQALIRALGLLLQKDATDHTTDLVLFKPIDRLGTLSWALIELLQQPSLDNAVFYTYLNMLTDAAATLQIVSALTQELSRSLNQELKQFSRGIQLSTGLSMERIWRHFKPTTSRTQDEFDAMLRLEDLADRFDAAVWHSAVGLDELCSIRGTLSNALAIANDQNVQIGDLIKNLETGIQELERTISQEDLNIDPYFNEEFEGLCQYVGSFKSDTAEVTLLRKKSSVFGRRSTKSTIAGADSIASSIFRQLYEYLGIGSISSQAMALGNRFHNSLLAKINRADEVTLRRLQRFENELQVLSQHTSVEATRLIDDQCGTLKASLQILLTQLSVAHGLPGGFNMGTNNTFDRPPTVHLHAALQRSLESCQRYIDTTNHNSIYDSSQAWINFAIAGICLYIPDSPFDPALRPMIERKFFNERRLRLRQDLEQLCRFQHSFTGQDTSLRISFTQHKIEGMGPEPPVPEVVRPAVSEMEALQGEFSNLLSVVQPLTDSTISVQDIAQDQTFRNNLSHIIRRLVEGYRIYDDITTPAVGFLVCLQVGLTIAAQAYAVENAVSKSLSHISTHTPFFGCTGFNGQSPSLALFRGFMQNYDREAHAADLRWHALQFLSILANRQMGELTGQLGYDIRGFIHNIFSSFYSEWKEKLVKDQEKEAANTSLYTYRGEQEDEDNEGDPSLFPDYQQGEADHEVDTIATPEEVSPVRLAALHEEIMLGERSPESNMKRLISWSSAQVGKVSGGDGYGTSLENSLPAIFLALHEKSEALMSTSAAGACNFYFDANISEAKTLIKLVHKVQHRYRQIRAVWPEHATLSDVLRTCDEALAFRHVDPVAKFLTKAEKLHSYMYEWGRVTSKEFNTVNLYDELTRLLISWRQLELTTWARLFDIEMEKCHDNAKSWFFIAYETIIAAPESIGEDREAMTSHAKELLKTLESFFANTTMGQYQQRMGLLKQYRRHIAMRMQDIATLQPIHRALDNFIAYFCRFEKPIEDVLVKGRQKLAKEVNNVIKLASWKDTNIDALRQSAKTSHRKLSKLVRKFRALLNQPVSEILKQDFPEEQSPELQSTDVMTANPGVSKGALQACQESIPEWSKRPSRFTNIPTTIRVMRTKAVPSIQSIDGATYIDSFRTDLETNIESLRKATPPALTEENKESVKHLKSRKRKLYADTMREIRQMGFKPNPSGDVLARQDTLATVLANLSAFPLQYENGRSSQYLLHRLLSIMPQVREVSREHSGDLTSNDVSRSIGYLESLLHTSIRQRNTLVGTIASLQSFTHQSSRVDRLSDPEDTPTLSEQSSHQNLVATSELQIDYSKRLFDQMAWLKIILNVGADLVGIQAKLGKFDCREVIGGLKGKWVPVIETACLKFDHFNGLPHNIWTTRHEHGVYGAKDILVGIEQDVRRWMSDFPLLTNTLRQILPWLASNERLPSIGSFSSAMQVSVKAASKEIFDCLDMVLGSMQDVEMSLEHLPTSLEDASWLMKEEETLAATLMSFHTGRVTTKIKAIIDTMQYLKDSTYANSGLQAIAALFTFVRPVLEQYKFCYESILHRFTALHTATTRLAYRLAKDFVQIGKQGFCTPSDKSADQQPGKDDKLESGTGLGEGEGAEDISKDIEDDEDLEDLAQEKSEKKEDEIEEQDDAVDMGEQEMEGEIGDVGEKEEQEGSGDEGSEDEIEDEVGEVDDLGPSAVDEKMWDEGGDDKDEGKDKEGDGQTGSENKEEQAAAKEREEGERDDDKKGEAGGEKSDEVMDDADDQEEHVGMGENETMDPFTKEEETLDLPDELNMDGNQDDGSDDDDLGDLEDENVIGGEEEVSPEQDVEDPDIGEEEKLQDSEVTTEHTGEDEEAEKDKHDEDENDDNMVPLPDEQPLASNNQVDDDDERTNTNTEGGVGIDAYEDPQQNQDASASAATHEEGSKGDSSEQTESTAEEGKMGQTSQLDAAGRGEDAEESAESQQFKKLGDALEKWYNQQRQIRDATKKDETQVQQTERIVDMADAEFEHLPDEDIKADAQALGAAEKEQAKALDESMALPMNDDEERITAIPENQDTEGIEPVKDDAEMLESDTHQGNDHAERDGQPQAFIGEQKSREHQDQDMQDATEDTVEKSVSETSSVHDMETQLSQTHLDRSHESTLPTPETARTLWLHHESTTQSLSQQLTEHLRLILAPTLATKLRGDFRTGKRLNLKRIIPYIASGYKRDKIWLRRSQPSKRAYQILIALDDSKSMAESGAAGLALKTLALVTRSLAMLEVGEVGVAGFGDDVTVAHEFDRPFTSEAGVDVFSKFAFQARKTDVKALVEKSLSMFEDARRRGTSSGEDLWQLMLIISDGICDDHGEILKLVRRAMEMRVMVVFVVVDATANSATLGTQPPASGAGQQAPSMELDGKKEEPTSILDLQSVEITPEGKVVRWRYMDRFPFRWYLVVRDVAELPGVLATALRQWFAEVVDSTG